MQGFNHFTLTRQIGAKIIKIPLHLSIYKNILVISAFLAMLFSYNDLLISNII